MVAGMGCGPTPPAADASDSRVEDYALHLPTRAQPRLPTIKLWVGAEELTAELARTLPQIRAGMMFRESMAEDEAMLFIFAREQKAAFWMKNTKIPLSVAYIDSDGRILEIHDMQPHDETSIPSASRKVRYALEVPQGWFERHNIKPGARMRTEAGTLEETFFTRRSP